MAPFWLPIGSLLEPFDSLLALFGSLWLTFGTLFEEIMKTCINSLHFHEFAHNSEENTQQPDPRANHPLLDLPLPPGLERNLAEGNLVNDI